MQQIAEWLESLGMAEYAQRFVDNAIDLSVLPDLTDQDLAALESAAAAIAIAPAVSPKPPSAQPATSAPQLPPRAWTPPVSAAILH